MRTVMKKISMAALALLLTAGCAQLENSGVSKRDVGAATGALAGGVLGSQIGDGSGQLFAVGAGTLLGALVGSEVGASLERADMAYANQAFSQAHQEPLGETVVWSNPESGHRGSYTPIRQGKTTDDRICRQYEQTIIVDGIAETAVGTACRNNDGTWEVIR